MTDFENWCKETGYNPHTFEALQEYWRLGLHQSEPDEPETEQGQTK